MKTQAPRGFILLTQLSTMLDDDVEVLVPVSKIATIFASKYIPSAPIGSNAGLILDIIGAEPAFVLETLDTIAILINKARG